MVILGTSRLKGFFVVCWSRQELADPLDEGGGFSEDIFLFYKEIPRKKKE